MIMRGLAGINIVGADIVEVSPPYDHADITANAAAGVVAAASLPAGAAQKEQNPANKIARNETPRIAILGASGYTGAELVRLLLNHPRVEIVALTGESKAGLAMGEVYPHLRLTICPGSSKLMN